MFNSFEKMIKLLVVKIVRISTLSVCYFFSSTLYEIETICCFRCQKSRLLAWPLLGLIWPALHVCEKKTFCGSNKRTFEYFSLTRAFGYLSIQPAQPATQIGMAMNPATSLGLGTNWQSGIYSGIQEHFMRTKQRVAVSCCAYSEKSGAEIHTSLRNLIW